MRNTLTDCRPIFGSVACSLAPITRPEMALPTGWRHVAGVGATQQNTSLFWRISVSVEPID